MRRDAGFCYDVVSNVVVRTSLDLFCPFPLVWLLLRVGGGRVDNPVFQKEGGVHASLFPI